LAAARVLAKLSQFGSSHFDLPGHTWQSCADSAQLDNAHL
jgi:hypothetical protein